MPDLTPKFNLRVRGNPTASQTLVFAHGYGSDQTAWRFVIPAFEAQYRLVLFDWIGCGASDLAEFDRLPYTSLQNYADDLIEICDTLQLDHPILIAHSVSCMVGTLVTLRRPELFAKMVFIGASPRYINDVDYIGGFTQTAVLELLDNIANNFLGWVHGFAPVAMNAPAQPALAAEFARSLGSMRPDIAAAMGAMIFLSDYRHEVAQLKTPTLLIQAHADVAVPLAVGEYLQRTIPSSTLQVISATGHFPHMSNPAECIQAIREYV